MKQIACIAIAAAFLTTGCKKSSSTSTPTTPATTIPSDGWKLGATTYKQLVCLRQASQFALNCLDATSTPINSFAAFFKAYPTASGTYHIVNIPNDSTMLYVGQNIGANDIIITGSVPLSSTSDRTYWSIGTDAKDATVTITGGKMKIVVPEIKVVSNGDTLKLSGTMIEN